MYVNVRTRQDELEEEMSPGGLLKRTVSSIRLCRASFHVSNKVPGALPGLPASNLGGLLPQLKEARKMPYEDVHMYDTYVVCMYVLYILC